MVGRERADSRRHHRPQSPPHTSFMKNARGLRACTKSKLALPVDPGDPPPLLQKAPSEAMGQASWRTIPYSEMGKTDQTQAGQLTGGTQHGRV